MVRAGTPATVATGFHVPDDDSAGADDGAAAHANALDDRCVRPHVDVVFEDDVAGHPCTGQHRHKVPEPGIVGH